MLNFGAAKAVDFLPDEDSRTWIADGLRDLVARLGEPCKTAAVVVEPPSPRPASLDDLFEVICGVQAAVGQSDVEFTLLEMGAQQPEIPKGFVPLGDPGGQLMHTFAREAEFLIVAVPALLRLPEVVMSSIARELGRIGVHRAGGHQVEPADYEADAELAAIALGLGPWVATGSYVFENACCGGGCGIDLSTLRAGLSMPEACFAVALDGHRRGLSRRAVGKRLPPTQKAAFKQSWGYLAKREPELLALAQGKQPAALSS